MAGLTWTHSEIFAALGAQVRKRHAEWFDPARYPKSTARELRRAEKRAQVERLMELVARAQNKEDRWILKSK